MLLSELEAFYDINAPKIYRFFFYKVLNREISEDLTSKVFLAFAKELKKETPMNNARAFLFGVANNVFNDYLHDKYQMKEVCINEELENSLSVSDDDYVQSYDIIDLLEQVIGKLPEKQALVMRLRFIDKLSIAEIAEKLGKDGNYVSTTQKRGLKSLRAVLDCTELDTNIVEE
jgi:RNA polymerase sigma-70 factor (ECF subfamily)